jgi:YfiH family protein
VLAARRRAVVDLPWVAVHQVHGARVLRVARPLNDQRDADATVTDVPGLALAVQGADCPLVALSSDGAVGAVHAGWRGLVGGVIEAAVNALHELSHGPVHAVIGPCIGPECYEFGADDLDRVASALGDSVRATTTNGRPALDLRIAATAALTGSGVSDVDLEGGCTACGTLRGEPLFSHRARGDTGRHAGVVWLESE